MTRFAIFAAWALALAGVEPIATGQANAAPGHARLLTATFAIGNRTCASCPITVKAAMSRVSGVNFVDVNFGAKTATATFDPTHAILTQIAAASANAGYPAKPLR